MMASSQVEIATSSPFVHDRRDPCFQSNLNRGHIDLADLWVHRPRWQTPTATATADDDGGGGNDKIARNHKPNKWAKAREIVFNVDHGSTKGGAGGLAEISNLGGVSSLLQKWRGFEAKRSTGTMFQMDNIAAASADPTPTPSPSPSLYEDVDSVLGDWEPDRPAPVTAPPPSRRRDSMAIDIERLKVSDIVKRLTVNDVAGDSSPRAKVSSSDQSDKRRCPSPVVNSPRIRGRQALNDFLRQIERDRNKELEGIVARKPVSNFSHRGRIQALLRFRFLRRGMEAKEDCHSNANSSQTQKAIKRVKPSAQKGSAISDCCHKEVVDNTRTAKNVQIPNQDVKATVSKRCPEKKTGRIHDSEGSVASKQHGDVVQSSQKVKEAKGTSVHLCHSYENLGHAANPFSALIRKSSDWENNHKQLAKSAGNDGLFHSAGINFREKTESSHTIETTGVHNKEENDTNHHQVTINNFEELSSYNKDEQTQDLVDTTSMYWVSDHASNPEVEWDELQSDNQLEEQEGSSIEWMYQVSRPRSDWEGLRQERYQEMLDHFLDNEEIRVLLGRRNVSTFLSSNLREKIEQVMVSRTQGRVQQTLKNDKTQVKEKLEISLSEQVGVSDEQDKGEDYNDINFDEYEEAYESSVGQQYNNESDDCTDQITTSSWPQNQSSDYSYHHQIPSPSPFPSTQQSPSNFYSQNSSRRPNSSDSAHPSAIDMELIYDLRGHMEQLHQEMSELRKTIKCCVDMQINLQRSIKKEVVTALHGGYSEANNGRRNAVKKVASTSGRTGGMCCVCRKMPVDSLLYRCGHMCTCFKCAHKLHWSSGKCPICRAPILDVVRTYSNHS